ncbi:hypothetical protein [Bradyrhizobium liaoningense]|uniref:hypothetical protein n=1 Tax=Bradyrhizobium liaoningense TaxID=43992 RepID=UPI001BAC132E|nr:hypothetical protein [Bradyrhizobium liaoningense]MBR0719809.1 hypothetical protein [Bradyrhizobium liaoningense]
MLAPVEHEIAGRFAHFARDVGELVERLADHTLELADIGLDRLLAGRRAGVAVASWGSIFSLSIT